MTSSRLEGLQRGGGGYKSSQVVYLFFLWGHYIYYNIFIYNNSSHLLSFCHVRLSEGFVCFISVNFQCNPLRQSTFNLTVSIFFMKKPRLREAVTFLISYIL